MMTPRLLTGACLLLLCCRACASSQELSLPVARCLTPTGETLDFADLVVEECKTPQKKESGKPKPGEEETDPSEIGEEMTEPEAEDCEAGVTASELQRNIIDSKDPRCVAQILIQTVSVGGIEDGFRVEPNFNFRPNCGMREFDPDVVALKGIALGLLEGVRGDAALIDKVVDGVVTSFTPAAEIANNKTVQVMGNRTVDRNAFAAVLRNATLMRETFDEDPNNSPPCNKEHPPPINTTKPSKPKKSSESDYDRRRLLSHLRGGQQAAVRDFDELVVGSSRRRLHCADCDNADSFPCAYCWQEDVCSDLYWCQDA